MNILVAEDDPAVAMMTSLLLEDAGYRVVKVYDGPGVLRAIKQSPPHLVLLDVKMPKIDGFDVCRRIRRISDVPIIFLSACSHVQDRVLGLRIGGDDYIVKPFEPQELLARIEVQLRRYKKTRPAPSACLNVSGITLDPLKYQITFVNDRALELPPIEFRLLYQLAKNAGQVLSTDQLLDKVWGDERKHKPNLVAHYIHHLRKRIEIDPDRPQHIITVPHEGYKFEA